MLTVSLSPQSTSKLAVEETFKIKRGKASLRPSIQVILVALGNLETRD